LFDRRADDVGEVGDRDPEHDLLVPGIGLDQRAAQIAEPVLLVRLELGGETGEREVAFLDRPEIVGDGADLPHREDGEERERSEQDRESDEDLRGQLHATQYASRCGRGSGRNGAVGAGPSLALAIALAFAAQPAAPAPAAAADAPDYHLVDMVVAQVD